MGAMISNLFGGTCEIPLCGRDIHELRLCEYHYGHWCERNIDGIPDPLPRTTSRLADGLIDVVVKNGCGRSISHAVEISEAVVGYLRANFDKHAAEFGLERIGATNAYIDKNWKKTA